MRAAALLAAALPAAAREVKVLSWVGEGAGIDDVDQQHKCFKKDLISGVTIRGTKSKHITADTLKGYDVLLMPGGSMSECHNSLVDNSAVRAFVKAGGGYYGTCAGAFCGCQTYEADPKTGIINPYTGRKVAPVRNASGALYYPSENGIGISRASCNYYNQVGATKSKMTATGTKVFGLTGDVTIDHHNGPWFSANGATVAADFDSGSNKGKASIVVDSYGSGRSILISPHPEHPDGTDGVKQNCGLVSRAAAYAAGAAPQPVPPGAARYHCDAASSQCVVAVDGHSTVDACLSACGDVPSPRFHCDKTTARCVVQADGHSTVASCLAACQGS